MFQHEIITHVVVGSNLCIALHTDKNDLHQLGTSLLTMRPLLHAWKIQSRDFLSSQEEEPYFQCPLMRQTRLVEGLTRLTCAVPVDNAMVN